MDKSSTVVKKKPAMPPGATEAEIKQAKLKRVQ
jgi:hypothetical protein